MRRTLAAAAAVSFAAALAACAPTPEQRFDQAVEATTEEGAALRSFRKAFPEDFAVLRQQVIGEAGADTSTDAMTQRVSLAVRNFTIRKAAFMAKAPDENLHEMARGNAEFIRSLQKTDVNLCAKFGLQGLDPGDRLDPASEKISTRLFGVQIRAARAGMDRPVERPDITKEDGAKLADQIRRNGADERMLNLIANNMAGATPAEQCAASVAMYQAVYDLGPADAAKWTGFVIKQSAKRMGPPQPVR